MIFDYLLDILFLPVIFFIGLITSYQDFRFGKIKNKWVILGTAWGLGLYILFLIWALIAPYLSQVYAKEFIYILPSYVFKALLNGGISLIFSYLLWYFDFWSAGDAKLFFVFSLLLPLKYYWRSALPYFPSFALLVNIFILLIIFLFLQSIFYLTKETVGTKNWRRILEEKFFKWHDQLKINWLSWLKVILGFGLIFLLLQVIRIRLATYFSFLNWYQAAIFFLLILIARPLGQIFRKWSILLVSVFGLTLYLIYSWFVYPQNMNQGLISALRTSFYYLLAFGLFSLLTDFYIKAIKTKHLPFAFWVLVGTLITIILKGSFVSLFFRSYFHF